MKQIRNILLITAVVLSTVSCNKWLNVTPQGNIEAEDLYKTTKGCNSVVGGIYFQLTSSQLYGRELSYGMMDILAQYWDLSANSKHAYYKIFTYDYEDSYAVSRFNSIWATMYQAVTSCNAFLEYSAPYKDDIDNYDLLCGEVYALRAFIHMRLFEMFGPVIRTEADLKLKSIAYRDEYSVLVKDFEPGEDVLAKAEADLKKALELLKNDPIKDPAIGRRGDSNTSDLAYQDVLNFRGARMNYFCAMGLLAQLEMLRHDKDAALGYAKTILKESEGILALADKSQIDNAADASTKDINYSSEMLGSFYVNNLYDMTNSTFGMGGVSTTTTAGLIIDNNTFTHFMKDIYGRTPDGAGTDIRLRYWFEDNKDGGSYKDFVKLRAAKDMGMVSLAYFPEVSIMRLSEIYYIAAESQIGKDNKAALDYLNAVRIARGLEEIAYSESITNEMLLEYIVRDAKKDLIGEGRMFLMYKRLNYPMYLKAGVEVEPSDLRFVFPIPDDEYEYTGNEKPNKK